MLRELMVRVIASKGLPQKKLSRAGTLPWLEAGVGRGRRARWS
jgi:hypothetical protein